MLNERWMDGWVGRWMDGWMEIVKNKQQRYKPAHQDAAVSQMPDKADDRHWI